MEDRTGKLYPVRSANVIGVPAVAVIRPLLVGPKEEYRSVKEAEDIDRERSQPADVNHCPLCNEYFGPAAFLAHAQDCINTRAPKWERQRDREPIYNGPSKNGGLKRFGKRLTVPGFRGVR